MSMVLPGVVGFKLSGKLRDGVTATDLVLTVTQMLRKHGVVGKFVEFYGKIYLLIVFILMFMWNSMLIKPLLRSWHG